MHYLQVKHVLKMHSFAIDESGGLHGIRDRNRLESAIVRPQQSVFGKELFITVFLKAAALAHAIIFDHPFVDGNKRTAMIAAFVFLEDNGYQSTLEHGKIHAFALHVVRQKLEIPAIASWLKKHSQKIT
jgi:death-on-curing protein